MWRGLEADAIRIGLDLHYFWSLTPKQFEKHISVFNEMERQRMNEKDMLNYMLGKYVMFAFNDPKRYPSKPFTEHNTDLKPMTDEEMERQGRRNTIKMGGVISDG
jgi:hypothetical protein